MRSSSYSKRRKRAKQNLHERVIKKIKPTFQRKSKLKDSVDMSFDIIDKNTVYLNNQYTRKRPAWFIPLLIALTLIISIFWVGPYFVSTLSGLFRVENGAQSQIELLYNTGDYAVINKQFTDLLEVPDLKASRVSQLLFNDLVKIIDRQNFGYLHVELQDGFTGYIRIDDVLYDATSVEPSLYSHKVIVVTKSKRIMSHAGSGSLIQEVCMGSVLYSDYSGDGVYRVVLPDKSYGWISSEGIVRTEVDEIPEISNAKKFYETALSFVNSTYIRNGLTEYGASSSGITYICAKINGVTLSRNAVEQSIAGEEVLMSFDEETGLLIYDNWQAGDLVFFRNELAEPGTISEMGIVVGTGQILMSQNSKNSIKIVNISDSKDLNKSIVAVRRIFAD